MTLKVRIYSLSLLCLVLASAWLLVQVNDARAPNVVFKTISGSRIHLQSHRGKPVLVTFWATDCASCIREIPHLVELYDRYHSQGLEIIAVAMYYDPPNHVVNMTRAKQLPYPVALDLTRELSMAFGEVRLTPTTFLIAPDGKIAYRTTGAFEMDEMKNRIENFLEG